MISPIKETPILRGKDAIEFLKKINSSVKISPEEKKKLMENYEYIKNLFKSKDDI